MVFVRDEVVSWPRGTNEIALAPVVADPADPRRPDRLPGRERPGRRGRGLVGRGAARRDPDGPGDLRQQRQVTPAGSTSWRSTGRPSSSTTATTRPPCRPGRGARAVPAAAAHDRLLGRRRPPRRGHRPPGRDPRRRASTASSSTKIPTAGRAPGEILALLREGFATATRLSDIIETPDEPTAIDRRFERSSRATCSSSSPRRSTTS